VCVSLELTFCWLLLLTRRGTVDAQETDCGPDRDDAMQAIEQIFMASRFSPGHLNSVSKRNLQQSLPPFRCEPFCITDLFLPAWSVYDVTYMFVRRIDKDRSIIKFIKFCRSADDWKAYLRNVNKWWQWLRPVLHSLCPRQGNSVVFACSDSSENRCSPNHSILRFLLRWVLGNVKGLKAKLLWTFLKAF